MIRGVFARVPLRSEIAFLPVVAACATEWFHTPANELYLLFVPFPTCTARFVPNQIRRNAFEQRPGAGVVQLRAIAWAYRFDTLALFPLLLCEAGVVVAGSPTTPRVAWVWVAGLDAAYLALRFAGRHFWSRAAWPEDQP